MKVLFVCHGNVGRSQIAEGFFNNYSEKENEAISAGTHAEEWNGRELGKDFAYGVVKVMKEKGIDLSGRKPKQLNKEMCDCAEKIVWITNKESVPNYINQKKILYWDVSDPMHMDYFGHCKVRDKIEYLVKGLVKKLDESQA